jgi:hypothetical protein
MTINQAFHDHALASLIFNNMQACYDQAIENNSNMSLRALGSPGEPLKLHANTQKLCKYYPGTRMGVSETCNTHSAQDPFLGAGQGKMVTHLPDG